MPNEDEMSRCTVAFYNCDTQKLASKITLKEPIESLRASKGCVGINSLTDIFIVHFPSLGSIYKGEAGNSLEVVYDISYEGKNDVRKA